MQLGKTIAFVGCVLGMALVATPGQAGFILSPNSVVGNTLGELDPVFATENLINQSGLSSGFTSGTTDFDTYIGTAPTHTSPSSAVGGGYLSANPGVTAGTIDFDLGAEYQLSRMVLWNDVDDGEPDDQAIASFTLFVSNDSAFASSTNLGTFSPTEILTDPVQLEVFDIIDGAGRYVRLSIHSTQSETPHLVNFGEFAFDAGSVTVNAVPAPGALAIFGLGLAGIGFARRRRAA